MSEILHIIALTLHVVGATIILGSAFVTLLAVWKQNIARENYPLLNRVWRVVGPTMGIQILTGLYLGISEWHELGTNPIFWTKLVLTIATGATSARLLSRSIAAELPQNSETKISRWAMITFLLFLLISTMGVILGENH